MVQIEFKPYEPLTTEDFDTIMEFLIQYGEEIEITETPGDHIDD